MERARARRHCLSLPLPDEIMVEVLLRAPIKSLLRCQSVCKDWFRLINSSPPLKHVLVMLKILPRGLPVKSLLQFRSVSKSWLKLISLIRFDPCFKKVRDNNNNNNNVFTTSNQNQFLLVCTDTTSPEPSLRLQSVDLLDGKLHDEFRIKGDFERFWHAGSSHGLVYFSDFIVRHIIVCNPSTHEWVKLPVPSFASFRHRLRPGPSNMVMGMGFLPESNTHKFVVRFPYVGYEVFTLKEGVNPRSCKWRLARSEVNLSKPPQAFYHSSRGVYTMGKFHWMLTNRFLDLTDGWRLLAFDLTTEEESIIQPPASWYYKQGYQANISKLRGSMCVVETGLLVAGTVIWVLRDGDKWDPPCIIHQTLPRVVACVPERTPHSASASGGQLEEKDLNLVFMPGDHSSRLGYYNTKNKSISMTSQGSWLIREHSEAFVYADTLFSLKPHGSRGAKKKQEAG